MAVTTLSTQIFQYREDTAAPPMTVVSAGTVVQNPLAGNGVTIASGATSTVVGGYQIITFTGSGSFTVNQTGNVEMLLVGGGGGTSSYSQSDLLPGAGAGGVIYYGPNLWEYRSGTSITLTAGTTYTVTIGAGGGFAANSSATSVYLTYGGNTSIVGGSINLTAYGGCSCAAEIADGGGAGGAVRSYVTLSLMGVPATRQGYMGGACGAGTSRDGAVYAAGGGGAGTHGGLGAGIHAGTGYDTTYSLSGWGGNGILTDISGTVSYYAGGGGGGSRSSTITANNAKQGGLGGGGYGAIARSASSTPGLAAANGTTNTGGGGGGAAGYTGTGTFNTNSGGQGGSGVLIIKIPLYSITSDAITTAQNNLIATGNTATGGASITYSGNYRIHTFTGSGTFTAQHTGYIEYLIIAGGGAGGYAGSYNAGGGGGGGFLEHYETSVTGDFQGTRMFVNSGDSVTVVVGAGGAIQSGYSYAPAETGYAGQSATNGSDSLIRNPTNKTEIIAYGGGGGGSFNSLSPGNGMYGGWSAGQRGGSGGGAAAGTQNIGMTVYTGGPGGDYIGSSGGTRQGYPGKYSINVTLGSASPTLATSPYYGGGAGADGASGGAGRASTITGASVTYSAGGGSRTSVGQTSTVNSGNGGVAGAGSTLYSGAAGGSGIVIIRYRFQ